MCTQAICKEHAGYVHAGYV
uniref:Uncharacterized protein n=1 Tax=Anguilla anguilla TaxID=7936 RepID=A0A0E9W281_ANGAN